MSSDEVGQQQQEGEEKMETEEESKDTEMTTATNNNEGDNDDDDDDDDEQMIDLPDLDDDDGSTASNESSKKQKEDPEVLLIKALAFKEEGNNYFIKEKDFDKASRSYRKGVNAIKNLNKENSGDEQVKTLLLSLNTNLSMMLSKLGKHRQSKDVANKALEIDPMYVKARFRRAVAHRKLGNTEEATMDLKLALQSEPDNVAVRKELASIQKEQKLAKKAQKASLQKAFSKGGLLNDNRVEDEKTKTERLAREKKEAEEVLKKRKKEWEDDCVSRMAKGEDAISFEDWDKEQLEKVKAEEEEATRKRKEDEKKQKEERKKAKAAKKVAEKEKGGDGDDGDSDDEFTERELAEMRGYKKTADGGVTSYFTREQSAEEKAMLDIAPKSINDYTPQPITPSSSTGDAGSSAWNHAGTWYVICVYSVYFFIQNHLKILLLYLPLFSRNVIPFFLHGLIIQTGKKRIPPIGVRIILKSVFCSQR
jgi:tetratricopeptide (TPR) repeat protein